MPTSLAEQLNRLKTPQTSLLVHRKFKPSFLFDQKEAAKFDRDTIYELGLSGLEELKKLNPQFSIFEDTLFDVTSKSFERAVESKEANEKLDCHIKTFLILLSPYFLLKPAHKALEWLINRYHIHDFNVDDILFLILPYHETLLFARMVQLLPIKPDTGTWHWLHPVKKEGVALSKTALLNRASTDMAFLKFVCNMPSEAIKISGNKASSLGTLFAFYCTTVIGGLEYAKPITELHVSHILPSLMSALGSSLPDFIASGYMIIARLVSKACLGEKIFEGLLNKISKVDSVKMRSETSLVLVLLCQNNENKYRFPEKAVRRLGKEQWFLTCLSTLCKNKILIMPLVLSMLRTSLQIILKGDEELKSFVQNLLSNIPYDSSDAEEIFGCLLNEFDKECAPDILKWYSDLLKEMENTFPMVFDKTASAVLAEDSKAAKAIKTLLGVNTSRNDLYQKLVHPNSSIRVSAVKHIRKNYKPDQLAWLKGPLLERLKDDSPEVVEAILRLPLEFFVDTTSVDVLYNYLIKVISKFGDTKISLMEEVALTIFKIVNENYSTLSLIILLNNPALEAVLELFKNNNTPFPNCCKYFDELQKSISENKKNYETFGEHIWHTMKTSNSLPATEEIIVTFNKFELLKSYSGFWFSTSLLIASTLPDNFNIDLIKNVMEFLMDYLKFPKLRSWIETNILSENSIDKFLELSRSRELPVQGALHCLTVITTKMFIKKSNMKSKWFNFLEEDNSILLSIYNIIHQGCLAKKGSVREVFEQYQIDFIKNHFPDADTQVNFIINALIYDERLMLKGLQLVSELCRKNEKLNDVMEKESLIIPGLLLLLSSTNDQARVTTLKIFSKLSPKFDGFYKPLVSELLTQTEEIKLDHEQVAVFLYTKLSPSKEVKSLMKKSKHETFQNILNQLIKLIISSESPTYIKAKFLKILELVQSKDIFLQLNPLALDLIGQSKVLNQNESEVFCYVMKRFNESVSECVLKEDIWTMMEKVIEDHTTIVIDIDTQKKTCPTAILLKQISREFFDSLPAPLLSHQERLLSLVVRHVCDVDKDEVINACTQLFKRIVIDCKILVNLLTPMITIDSPASPDKPGVKPKRKSILTSPSTDILGTNEWKQGVCLLELIQNKKKLLSMELLLPTLFNLLKRCLQFEQQSSVEYTKQLVLTSLLHICEQLDTSNKSGLNDELLHVDLIVDCVRASHNPQTHHHALLALAHIAKLIPDQVLHNIMAIFTFIGSSVLRKDDAYSFQIISKIIDTVIPVVVKAEKQKEEALSVAEVIRVFVAALLDVPEHRRIPLLVKLMNTLDASSYLWVFLCLVLESHVIRPVATSEFEIRDSKLQETNVPKRLEIAHQLCAEFPPEVILNTAYKLLVHLCSLPHDKDEKELLKYKDKLNKFIFNVETNTGKQLRHYKYTLLTFLSTLLSSNNFVLQLAELTPEEHVGLEKYFAKIVEQNMVYVRSVTKQCEECSNLPTAKYWKAILNQSYDILDKTNALLPTEGFLRVVNDLLGSELEAVRRKAMELLGWRLQQPRPVPEVTLMTLLPPLVKCLDSINFKEETNQDFQLTQQTALFALKLMARHLANLHPDTFFEVLEKVTNILCSEDIPVQWPVLGSLVLCLGELASMLKVRSLKVLHKFMPALISILHKHSKHDRDDLLLISIVTAVHKIVDALVNLLSPYLGKLLYEICNLSALHDNQSSDAQKLAPLPQKLKLIRQKISSDSPGRVLVPAVRSCYEKLIKNKKYSAVGPLMSILSESFTSSSDLTLEVTELLLLALDFRSSVINDSLTPNEINAVEDPVIAAFTHLVLKITESIFRPLFSKIYDWSLRSQGDKQRAITFFRLTSQIARSLKSLFALFAGIFIPNAAELLDNNNINKQNENWFEGDYAVEKSCILVDSILHTLLTIFTYDTHTNKFITKERFHKLMQPLVDQLENQLGGEELWQNRCTSLITPCISQMSTSIIDDSLWKQLNYQILLKMRNGNPQIRLAAMRTVCALAAKLGEDFLPLLPETVPFIAELLEDDDEEVERECQRIVNDLEEIIGEPVQKYF